MVWPTRLRSHVWTVRLERMIDPCEDKPGGDRYLVLETKDCNGFGYQLGL